jgi:hypothetical protein
MCILVTKHNKKVILDIDFKLSYYLFMERQYMLSNLYAKGITKKFLLMEKKTYIKEKSFLIMTRPLI